MEITLHRLDEGGSSETEFLVLTQQKSYTVGRKFENDIVLKSKKVSSNHCIFHHNPDGLFVEILKNEMGLFVNGEKKIEGTIIPLHNEDIIDIGETYKYKVQIEPLKPNITKENQLTSDFVKSLLENSVVKTEPIDPLSSEPLPQNLEIKLEISHPEFSEFQVQDVHPEQTDTSIAENGVDNIAHENNFNIPLPSTDIIKGEPDDHFFDTTHSIEMTGSEQAFEYSTGIAINPEEKSNLTHQRMGTYSSPEILDFDAVMQISIEENETKPLVQPLVNSETSTLTSQISILSMQSDNQDPLRTEIKEEPDLPNELTLQDEISQLDLNQVISKNGIKVENTELRSTTFFASTEKRIPELASSQDLISDNSEIPREKTWQIISNQSFLPENAEIPRAQIPDLEKGMQIDIEESDIKPFVLLPEEINSSLELNEPILKIRNGLELGIKSEPSIANQFQSSIESSILDHCDLDVRIKTERIDFAESFNEPQIKEINSGVKIKEEICDSPASPEVEFIEEKSRDSEENFFGIRVKPEINFSETDQTSPNIEANIQGRIKSEPVYLDSLTEFSREDSEIERGFIDYSEFVQDEIEIHEEKPGPSLMERLNRFEVPSETFTRKRILEESEYLPSAKRIKGSSDFLNSSDSDDFDDSNDSLESSGEEIVTAKGGENFKSLILAQKEELKRYMLISEIMDRNDDPEVVDMLIRELDNRLKRKKAKKKNEVRSASEISEKRESKKRRKSDIKNRDKKGDNKKENNSMEREVLNRRLEDSRRQSGKSRETESRSPKDKRDNSKESLEREAEPLSRRFESSNSSSRDRRVSVNPSQISPESSESSKDSTQVQELENERSDLLDRNYPGARVLGDYDLLEERRRSDPRDRSKYGARTEKKKLDYREYLKRRGKGTKRDEGSRDRGGPINENVAPVSNFKNPYSQPQLLVGEKFREPYSQPQILMGERFRISREIPNPVPVSAFNSQTVDPRFIQREHSGISVPLMDPRQAQGQFGIPRVSLDSRYQGRADLHSPNEASQDQRFIYSLENPRVPTVDSRYQDVRYIYGEIETSRVPRPRDLQPSIGETFSREQRGKVENSGGGFRDRRPTGRGIEDEVQTFSMNQKTGAVKSEDQLQQQDVQLNMEEEGRFAARNRPLESVVLSDELLVTIFSWDPKLFEGGLSRGTTPITSLRNVKKTALVYESYDHYCSIAFPLLTLDVSCKIQEAFTNGLERPLLQDCHVLPSTIPKIKILAQQTFLVPFLLMSSISVLDVSIPSAGDLLRFSLVSENKKSVVVFGYLQKVISEESTDVLRRTFTYLVCIREQRFDIHKSTIEAVKPVVNLKSLIEKAKAIFLLRKSPLLPCILRPKVAIDKSVSHNLLKQEELVSKHFLDKQQLIAMTKIIRSVEGGEPNICVIEGSSGTGKTNIVVNAILQLLVAQNTSVPNQHLRILVSASTNVEMDEIIFKLKSVLESSNIEKDVIKMVLVGPDEGRRERTKEFNLSNLARNHVESDIYRYQESMGLRSMEEQAVFLTEQMNVLKKKFELTKCVHVALQMSLIKMYYDIGRSGRRVKMMTPQEKAELLEVSEKTFLAGANLIFCSVPNLGCTVMENLGEKYSIGVCIIDEAAQILEMDTLKVLPFKERTLVLFGDIYKNPTSYDHLPKLRTMGIGCSLFSRIENNFELNEKSPVVRLLTQYRISPPIEKWLINSKIFGMNSLRNLVHQKINFPLHPLRIFNLGYTEDFIDNEAVFASRLIHCIVSFGNLRRMERNISVGVIISDIEAKNRVEQEIKNRMEEIVPGKAQIFNIEVDTIDGFLNNEKDIILASCIRNKHLTSHAGFQRFYCTVSRAKHCLIIYGRFSKVSKYKQPCEWHQLIDYTKNVVSMSAYAESTELRRDLIK